MIHTIALQTVIDIPGERKDLGYTLFHPAIIGTQEELLAVLAVEPMPLGWVVISLKDLGVA